MPERYLSYPASFDRRGPEARGPRQVQGSDHRLLSPRTRPTRAGKTIPATRNGPPSSAKYLTPADLIDANAVDGFCAPRLLVQVLKQCGDDLSRENIMRQAANIKDFELPMLLPGIKINTSPDNYLSDPPDAARRFQRRELGVVRRPDR